MDVLEVNMHRGLSKVLTGCIAITASLTAAAAAASRLSVVM